MEEYDWRRELWRAIKRNPPAAAMELLSLLALIFVGAVALGASLALLGEVRHR